LTCDPVRIAFCSANRPKVKTADKSVRPTHAKQNPLSSV
jgi:hypothetical protein